MNSIIQEVKKFSESVLKLNPQVEEFRIKAFINKYSLPLPEDYLELIKENNGFSLLGTELFGIFDENNPNSLGAVYEHEHTHGLFPMPKHFIPFSPDGAGGHYCFDVSKLTNDSCTIVFWQTGFEYTLQELPEITNNSFSDWVQDVVINWTLEDYNYDGTDKK